MKIIKNQFDLNSGTTEVSLVVTHDSKSDLPLNKTKKSIVQLLSPLDSRETSVVPEFKSTRFFIIFIPKICSVSSLKAQLKDSDYREPSEYSSKKIYFESHHLAAVWLFLYV